MRLNGDSGPGQDEPGSSGFHGGIRRFPLAAQPEIMRAAEKDDQYASFIHEACRDAFRHLFGTIFPTPNQTTTTVYFNCFIVIVQLITNFYHS
jgi:hypothetical protein